MPTINRATAASADDGYENIAGTNVINGTAIGAGINNVAEFVGLRFQNITIPQGSTITAASISLVPNSSSADVADLTIHGQDIDDAPVFTTGANNISARTRTTANVAWNEDLAATGSSRHSSPDISAIIQEIVDRGGWVSGNDIAIILQGASAGGTLILFAFDSGSNFPQIDITYTEPSVTATIGQAAETETAQVAAVVKVHDPLGQAVETETAGTVLRVVEAYLSDGPRVFEHVIHFTAQDENPADIDWSIMNLDGETVWSGTTTAGTDTTIPIPYQAPGLVDGVNRLLLTVETEDGDIVQRWFSYRQVSVEDALKGRFGPVVIRRRFERRTVANQFLADVTDAIVVDSCTIDLNNDRDTLRTARFTVIQDAIDDNGDVITITPGSDYIAPIDVILIDGFYEYPIQQGLYLLDDATRTHTGALRQWPAEGSDLTMLLIQNTTTDQYTVAAGQNYITGTNAVTDILDAHNIRHAFPSNTLTLPTAMTWPIGTTWLRIVNDLLDGIGGYILRLDRHGVATSRIRMPLADRTADVAYSGDDFIVKPINEGVDTTRLANRVVLTAMRGDVLLRAVASNDDPNNPVSTVSLGVTKTRPAVRHDTVADQATLDALAQAALDEASATYRRATIQTFYDPRRDWGELYELTVDDVFSGEKWQVRNWTAQLRTGAPMVHNLSKVERIGT